MTILASVLLILLAGVPAQADEGSAQRPEPRAILRALEDAFTAVADRVTPAVVNISAVPKRPTGGPHGESPERFREFFGDEFYERYFRRRPREDARASGSGVIVDPNGYILTNNHVIENADEVIVRLSDSRKFPARLIGHDPKTDLAVLKIEASAPLPAAELGNSDRLRVGQWAIAIGNPFGLDRTVTVGIISATARTHVGVATYENFIQTDASINPGNSGGPLLDLDGRVIGINTAIVASGQGIGFSIPINQARDVMRQLIAQGRVVRGWLGIVIQEITDELGQTFGVHERQGVLVADVLSGGPAEAAGLRPGDIVVELGGETIRQVPDLQRRVASVAPGQTVALTIVRDRQRLPVSVKVGEMPTEEPARVASRGAEQFGLTVEPLPDDHMRRLDLPAGGVVVTGVLPGSAAERAGLRRGDVIVEVGRRPVVDAAALYSALATVRPGESALLYVHRSAGGGRNEYVVLERAQP